MPRKGIIALCLTLLLTGCVNFNEPEFVSVNSVEIKELTLAQVTAVMNITLHNPNRHSITVEDVDVNVIIKNATVGKLTASEPAHILALSDADCNFTVRMSTIEAVRAGIMPVNDIFSKNISVQLAGTIKGKYGIFRKKLKLDTTIKPKAKQTK